MAGIIDSTMTALNAGGENFVQTAFNAFSPPVITAFKLLAGISVAWYGVRAMLGIGDLSLGSIFRQLMPIVVVVAILSSWSIFQTFFLRIVVDFPEEIGKALFASFKSMAGGGGGGGPSGSATDAGTGLQVAWDTGWDAVAAVWAKGGVTSMGAFLLAALIAVGVIFFAVGGFFIVLLAKIIAFVLLAIAPIFFMMACFQWTRQYVSSYINALFHVVIALIVSYAVIGFFLGIADASIRGLMVAAKNPAINMADIGPFLFFSFLGFFVFLQVPQLAAMLAGGISMNLGTSQIATAAMRPMQMGRSAANNGVNRLRGGSPAQKAAEQLELRRESHSTANAQMIANAVTQSRMS